MKIVVIGGTGLIGSRLVERLRRNGHEPLAASPRSGVNVLTGEGLAEAVERAQVVVDVSDPPSWDDVAVLEFFQTSSCNLLDAESAVGVGTTSRCRSSAPTGYPTAATFGQRSRRRKR